MGKAQQGDLFPAWALNFSLPLAQSLSGLCLFSLSPGLAFTFSLPCTPHSLSGICVCVHMHAHTCSAVSQLFATPWTVAHQAPLSMEYSRQEYPDRLPFPSPGDLPDPGIKVMSLASAALTGGLSNLQPPSPDRLFHLQNILGTHPLCTSFLASGLVSLLQSGLHTTGAFHQPHPCLPTTLWWLCVLRTKPHPDHCLLVSASPMPLSTLFTGCSHPGMLVCGLPKLV